MSWDCKIEHFTSSKFSWRSDRSVSTFSLYTLNPHDFMLKPCGSRATLVAYIDADDTLSTRMQWSTDADMSLFTDVWHIMSLHTSIILTECVLNWVCRSVNRVMCFSTDLFCGPVVDQCKGCSRVYNPQRYMLLSLWCGSTLLYPSSGRTLSLAGDYLTSSLTGDYHHQFCVETCLGLEKKIIWNYRVSRQHP